MGDKVTVVGSELAISHTEKRLGNSIKRLNIPNLIPIFLGIALGCLVANIPFYLPGIQAPLKLGLTGGPLVVAILIGFLGPKFHLITYNTISSNLMIREIGLCIFLACVGLGTGKEFIDTVFNGNGLTMVGYGAIITDSSAVMPSTSTTTPSSEFWQAPIPTPLPCVMPTTSPQVILLL